MIVTMYFWDEEIVRFVYLKYNIVKKMFTSEAAEKFFNTDMLVKMLDEHKDGKNTNEKTDNSRKIWTVYIFLVWYDRFFEHGKPVHPAMSSR